MFRPHSQTKNKREDLLKNHCWILKKHVDIIIKIKLYKNMRQLDETILASLCDCKDSKISNWINFFFNYATNNSHLKIEERWQEDRRKIIWKYKKDQSKPTSRLVFILVLCKFVRFVNRRENLIYNLS